MDLIRELARRRAVFKRELLWRDAIIRQVSVLVPLSLTIGGGNTHTANGHTFSKSAPQSHRNCTPQSPPLPRLTPPLILTLTSFAPITSRNTFPFPNSQPYPSYATASTTHSFFLPVRYRKLLLRAEHPLAGDALYASRQVITQHRQTKRMGGAKEVRQPIY